MWWSFWCCWSLKAHFECWAFVMILNKSCLNGWWVMGMWDDVIVEIESFELTEFSVVCISHRCTCWRLKFLRKSRPRQIRLVFTPSFIWTLIQLIITFFISWHFLFTIVQITHKSPQVLLQLDHKYLIRSNRCNEAEADIEHCKFSLPYHGTHNPSTCVRPDLFFRELFLCNFLPVVKHIEFTYTPHYERKTFPIRSMNFFDFRLELE